jgi:hypothetical protein
LRNDLNLPNNYTPRGTWSVERIEEEARGIIAEHGYITYDLLKSLNKKSLSLAIERVYPGSITGLKKELTQDSEVSTKNQQNNLLNFLEVEDE